MKLTFSSLRALLFGWLLALLAPTSANASNAYTVIKRWPVPSGDIARLIVISPDAATEADLTALGDILREDTKNERTAFVLIFTDPKAAALRTSPSDSRSQQELYARHHVGRYIRNAKGGVHEMQIFPSGIDGPLKIITY